jgi:hypothetical protein
VSVRRKVPSGRILATPASAVPIQRSPLGLAAIERRLFEGSPPLAWRTFVAAPVAVSAKTRPPPVARAREAPQGAIPRTSFEAT